MVEKTQYYMAKVKDLLTLVYFKFFKQMYQTTLKDNKTHKTLLKEFQSNVRNV